MSILFSSSFFWIALGALFFQVFGLGLFFRFYFFARPRKKTNGPFPGVTLFKPCFLTEDREEINYLSIFEQDYPGPLEILFVAARETDPAVELVRSFIARYPHVDARLLISPKREKAAWFPKIDSTFDAVKAAKYDIFISSDSDTVVNRDYITQMVSALEEPGVSLVSTPQWDTGCRNVAAGFKALGNNADSAVFILWHSFLFPKSGIALGQSLGFRISEFNSLPGDNWDFIYRFVADDVGYARLFSRAGKKTALRNIFCPVWFGEKSFAQVHNQKIRWLLNQRAESGHRVVYLCGMLLYPLIPSLAYFLFSGLTTVSAALLASSVGLRILITAVVERLYLGSLSMTRRYFWTVPFWDLSQIYYFIHGFLKSRFRFAGQVFRLADGCFYERVSEK